MHVLDRSHLADAVAIGAACAALAVVLTLVVAGTLNDFGSISLSGSPATAPASVRPASTGPGWNLSPLTRLLPAPVPVVWSTAS